MNALQVGLCPLDLTDERHVRRLLCDDSRGSAAGSRLLTRPDFVPDGFTVAERMTGQVLLHPSERAFDPWLSRLIADKLARIAAPAGRSAVTDPAVAAFCRDQTLRLLDHTWEESPATQSASDSPANSLSNQELPSVVDRVIAHCVLGDVRAPVATHLRYADRGVSVAVALAPLVLERCGTDLSRLLRYSLAAGLLGAEQKARAPGPGARLPIDASATPVATARKLWPRYRALAERPLQVDHWAEFASEVLDGPRRLVWFFDDCAETVIDLLLLTRLKEANPQLQITMVPKSLPCYTDADTGLLLRLLATPSLQALGVGGALQASDVCRFGPTMATANLRKLSPELAGQLDAADCVFVKGTNIHEMFQGGIDRPMYTGFVLVSEFNESAMGVDASSAPLFLVHSGPGEYAHWGFEGRESRTVRYSDQRLVRLCWSTLTDHQLRKNCDDPAVLREELRRLDSLTERVLPRTRPALDGEKALVHRALRRITGSAPRIP
ncbi:ARMT1-like domain-containing protein [Streptomyces lavendulae]|uniref:ARMT1-like domain-containing protein n=1 Tax=Streptomyces lavendulae TaxID=1914 RepID=UPI0033EDB64D